MYQNLLQSFTEMCQAILQKNLVGVYLHGSAAMGCFHPETSDLDLIVIVADSLSDPVKLTFMNEVVRLNEFAPQKGLELSIVKREFCKPFVYPTPFELHFSPVHLPWFRSAPQDYVNHMHGVDPDLAAHFTILGHCGIVLYGEQIPAVFAPVPRADYLCSIWLDIENAHEDILTDPVYIVLNLCRVLAYARDELILSKEAGGQWAMEVLPEKYHGFVQTLLECCTSARKPSVPLALAQDFADYMLGKIRPYIQNLGQR